MNKTHHILVNHGVKLVFGLVTAMMPIIGLTQHGISAAELTQQRTVGGILNLLEQTKPDPAHVAAYRAILDKPPPSSDAFWFTKRDALLERMDAAEALGDIAKRLDAATAIMQIFRERKDRTREMEFGMSYAGILTEAGKMAEAFALEEEVARDPQTYAHWLMTYNNRRTIELSNRGDVEGATPFFSAATNEYHRYDGYRARPNIASAYHYTRASFLRAQGKYAEAEANYQLANSETDRWLANMSFISKDASHALPSTRGYATYLSYRLGYASFLRDQGRLHEAQRMALQPLVWALQRQGKYSPHAVRAASSYAEVLVSQGRHVEAEQIASAAIEMAQGIGAASDSLFMRAARLALARSLLAQERVKEADDLFVQLEPHQAGEYDIPAAFAAVLNDRAEQVVEKTNRIAQLRESNLGRNNPLTGEAVGLHAMAISSIALKAKHRRGVVASIQQFKAALPAILMARQQVGQAEDALRLLQQRWILQAYLQALVFVATDDAEAMADSFMVADLLRVGRTQHAIAASAARASTGDPHLAAAVRKEQDLRSELVVLYRHLQQIASMSTDELKQRGIDPDQLRSRTEKINRDHGKLFSDIEKRFPNYANLVNPQPVTLEQLRSVLRPNEAVLSLLTTKNASYIWAVSPSSFTFHRSNLGESEIVPLVKSLRAALDVGNIMPDIWPDLDLNATYQLYKELVAPVQGSLTQADTLIFASSGSLSSLPLAVLTTAPHKLGADKVIALDRYLDVPWLDKRWATVQIPSINALVNLRYAPTGNTHRSAFMGFGDPVFSSVAITSATRGRRNIALNRPDEATLRNKQINNFIPYSKLSPLPDTRDELLALADTLGANPTQHVVLGAKATKLNVMQSDLSKTRVIAFATHGLLPGDFPSLTQPALALSPPPEKNADDQPLEAMLTLEDVLQLKLDADWVLLSACNTAAADEEGSEAVSGLGRGFFYAGSRSLLVTHWAVESESAKELVTETFRQYAAVNQPTRAKSLHNAMHTIRNGVAKLGGKAQYSWAHPLFWAPYALVGEPGR